MSSKFVITFGFFCLHKHTVIMFAMHVQFWPWCRWKLLT